MPEEEFLKNKGLQLSPEYKLRYVAGAGAQAMYAQRLQVGDEVFRKAVGERFFGN